MLPPRLLLDDDKDEDFPPPPPSVAAILLTQRAALAAAEFVPGEVAGIATLGDEIVLFSSLKGAEVETADDDPEDAIDTPAAAAAPSDSTARPTDDADGVEEKVGTEGIEPPGADVDDAAVFCAGAAPADAAEYFAALLLLLLLLLLAVAIAEEEVATSGFSASAAPVDLAAAAIFAATEGILSLMPPVLAKLDEWGRRAEVPAPEKPPRCCCKSCCAALLKMLTPPPPPLPFPPFPTTGIVEDDVIDVGTAVPSMRNALDGTHRMMPANGRGG